MKRLVRTQITEVNDSAHTFIDMGTVAITVDAMLVLLNKLPITAGVYSNIYADESATSKILKWITNHPDKQIQEMFITDVISPTSIQLTIPEIEIQPEIVLCRGREYMNYQPKEGGQFIPHMNEGIGDRLLDKHYLVKYDDFEDPESAEQAVLYELNNVELADKVRVLLQNIVDTSIIVLKQLSLTTPEYTNNLWISRKGELVIESDTNSYINVITPPFETHMKKLIEGISTGRWTYV